MAPKSQGLQVLLIVFVMLTVVLGVTTYLYNKRADEATKAATAATTAKQQAEKATQDSQKECETLKTLIGYPDRSTDDIKKQFAEDMQTYGNAKSETDKADKPMFDPNTLYYSRLLASMYKTIQDRSDDLIKSRTLYDQLQTNYKNLESRNDDKLTAYNKSYTDLNAQITKIADEYTKGLEGSLTQTKEVTSRIEEIKTKANAEVLAAADTVKQAKLTAANSDAEARKAYEKLHQLDRQEMDVPSGEITWVSLPSKLVWINRGRADSLQRQTKFTVYSGDSSGGSKAVKKGTVEVVRIDGDHSAQCRIVEDKLADPLMAGDKVFTPLWSPGQRNHFALTGIMNLDSDGRNQLNVVLGLINENGGEVDCWLDEQGHKQGQVTASTRYIVVGDAPDKSGAEFKKNHAEILHDAERYHLRIMTLADFKQQMGYQKSSSVEHFGSALPSPATAPPKRAKAAAAQSGT